MAEQKTKPARAKRPRDVNQLAHQLIREATDQAEPESNSNGKGSTPSPDVLRYMAEIGRRGGRIGGKRRMALLTGDARSDLASKAARARWSVKQDAS